MWIHLQKQLSVYVSIKHLNHYHVGIHISWFLHDWFHNRIPNHHIHSNHSLTLRDSATSFSISSAVRRGGGTTVDFCTWRMTFWSVLLPTSTYRELERNVNDILQQFFVCALIKHLIQKNVPLPNFQIKEERIYKSGFWTNNIYSFRFSLLRK